MQILVLGDGIAYGAWDNKGGWVQRLRKFLNENTLDKDTDFSCLVYNLGISGDTTEALLDRFEFEIEERFEGKEDAILIFEIGLNDSALVKKRKKTKNQVSRKNFEINIKKIIELCDKYRAKVIFLGLTPVDETKTRPIPWDTDKTYTNESVQEYNDMIKTICKESKVYFVDIFDRMMATDYKKLLEDGLHPNSEGHRVIYQAVGDLLIDLDVI